jgi:hypothetical protein
VSDNSTEVPPEEWRKFFEKLSGELGAYDVTIEVLSQEYGDDYEAEKLPLSYLAYDNKDDVYIVAAGGQDRRYPELHHIVNHPKRILVDTPSIDVPWAIDVEDAEGSSTIITFYHLPALPPSSA